MSPTLLLNLQIRHVLVDGYLSGLLMVNTLPHGNILQTIQANVNDYLVRSPVEQMISLTLMTKYAVQKIFPKFHHLKMVKLLSPLLKAVRDRPIFGLHQRCKYGQKRRIFDYGLNKQKRFWDI